MTSFTAADLAALAGRRVHVVGLAGSEGAAVTRFLWSRGVRDLTVHDLAEGADLRTAFDRMHVGLSPRERAAAWEDLAALPLARRLGADYLRGLESAEAIFVGQAWYLYEANRAPIAAAQARGVPLHGLMDLYFGLSPARIVAVTGSNGKSTTSRLVEHILRFDARARAEAPTPERPPRQIWYAGNDRHGVQVLDRLDEMAPSDVLVLEVSNRHLLGIAPRPWIGVVTNVLPNHLDEHGGSFDAYRAVKRRLIESQGAGDTAVLNADDPASRALGEGLASRVSWFSLRGADGAAAWRTATGRFALRGEDGAAVDLGAAADARLVGDHNHENILAAALAAHHAGAAVDPTARAVRTFAGLKHRLQFVWAAADVHYYDDLSATSPQATAAALAALAPLGRPIVLIVGGDDKGLDFAPLARDIARSVRRLVVLPGPGGDALAAALRSARQARGTGPAVDRFDDFAAAVADVVSDARPGETVLLSPACPHFFRRFYLDGAREIGFRALLRRLTVA